MRTRLPFIDRSSSAPVRTLVPGHAIEPPVKAVFESRTRWFCKINGESFCGGTSRGIEFATPRAGLMRFIALMDRGEDDKHSAYEQNKERGLHGRRYNRKLQKAYKRETAQPYD
jgi:hypothetical protein